MKIRLQADADIDPDIQKGLLRKEASVDFRPAAGIIHDAMPDPEVLRLAAQDGRILVSRDLRTMGVHLRVRRVARIARSFTDSVHPLPRRCDRLAALRMAELDA